jgi:hypothetical protein
MQAYRYETRIDQNGMIQLPCNPQLINQDVEIIVLPKQGLKLKNISSVDFVNKWAGFLSNADIEDSKYQYLNEKYK